MAVKYSNSLNYESRIQIFVEDNIVCISTAADSFRVQICQKVFVPIQFSEVWIFLPLNVTKTLYGSLCCIIVFDKKHQIYYFINQVVYFDLLWQIEQRTILIKHLKKKSVNTITSKKNIITTVV